MTNLVNGGRYTLQDKRCIHCGGSSVMFKAMSTINGLCDALVALDPNPVGLVSVAQLYPTIPTLVWGLVRLYRCLCWRVCLQRCDRHIIAKRRSLYD